MKKVIKILVILTIILILGGGGVLYALDYFQPEQKSDVLYINERDYTLPTVQILTEGQSLNYLAGYTVKMTQSNLRSSLVPLSSNRQMTVFVFDNGLEINKVVWKVYTLDGNTLLEEGTAASSDKEVIQGSVEIQYSPLIVKGTEYNVELILTQKNGREIYYYTRILMDETNVWSHVEFAEQFMNSTFDKVEAEKMIVPYMKTTTDTSTSLEHASLASAFRKLTWNDLAPTRISEPVITVTELYTNQSTILLDYEIASEEIKYHVTESYTMRTLDEQLYLMDFQRDVVQKTDMENLNYASGKLRPGLGNNQFDALVSSEKNYGAVIEGNHVWAYDGSMKLIYSLENDSHFITEQATMQLLSVDEETGNVSFLISGYLSRGVHAGSTGIEAYCYEKESGSLKELFYVQVDTSGEILKYFMREHSYLSTDNHCYFVCENTLYCVNLEDNSISEIGKTESENCIKVSKNRQLMAWTNTTYAVQIQLVDFESGEIYEINAPEQEYLVLEGFIGDAIVYGRARESDKWSGQDGVKYHPVYSLEIADMDGTVYSNYEKADLYVDHVEVTETTVTFDLMKRDGQQLVVTGNDTIMASQTEGRQEEVYFVTGTSENYIDLSVWAGKEISWDVQSVPIQATYAKTLKADIGSRGHKYYSYAAGHLYGISSVPGSLIDEVYSVLGVVVDENGNIVWARRPRSLYVTLNIPTKGEISEHSLRSCVEILLEQAGQDSSIVKEQLESGKSAYEVLENVFAERALDISGASMVSCYYYMNLGTPVMIQTDVNKAVLVTAFTPNDATIYDPCTGESRTISTAQIEEYTARSVGMYTYLK